MRQVVLGKSGLKTSAVGVGGIPIMAISHQEAERVLHKAFDLGVNFIDTAAGYGDSQKKIGRAIAGRREKLILASKSTATTRDDFLADVQRSRKELGADVLDLYQLHNVSTRERWDKMRAPGGALEGLLEARERGYVAHIGFTSHRLELALELADKPAFESVQFPFNLVTSEAADRLIPKAREHGLGFIVMKPLCGGEYRNATLAFKFLNGYPDLLPIPGVQREEEIEEIVGIVESRETLRGQEREEARRIANELGRLFCRRCGYCEPCPQGVPIMLCMSFDGSVNRLPRETMVRKFAQEVVEKAPLCIECRECEQKCPYELPIREALKCALEAARRLC